MILKLIESIPDKTHEAWKKIIKQTFKMEKHPTTSSFNLANATSQDLHLMIQSGDLPTFLTTNQRERIKELYASGEIFTAVRKLQGLIDAQGSKPKTFL